MNVIHPQGLYYHNGGAATIGDDILNFIIVICRLFSEILFVVVQFR